MALGLQGRSASSRVDIPTHPCTTAARSYAVMVTGTVGWDRQLALPLPRKPKGTLATVALGWVAKAVELNSHTRRVKISGSVVSVSLFFFFPHPTEE